MPLLLTGPAGGSAPWHRLALPSSRWGPDMYVAATPTLGLAVAFAGLPGAGDAVKRAWFSPGDGSAWQRLTDPAIGGYLSSVSITPAGTILLSGGRSDVNVSWDGGRTWHGTASTSPSMERVFQGGGALIAAMATGTQGFTIEPGGGSIWFTYDDAHTWHLVTIR